MNLVLQWVISNYDVTIIPENNLIYYLLEHWNMFPVGSLHKLSGSENDCWFINSIMNPEINCITFGS